MAPVSYLRTADGPEGEQAPVTGPYAVFGGGGRGRARWVALGLVGTAVLAVVGVGVALATGSAGLSADRTALAKLTMPFGGGSVRSIDVIGTHDRPIPVAVRAGKIWPQRLVAAGELISIRVVVKRPGWASWLTGSTETVNLKLRAPSAKLRSHYLTLHSGSALRLAFVGPVATISYGTAGHMTRRVLNPPRSDVSLPRTAAAGTITVAAAPRTWERSKATFVSWFPAGGSASAVATPAPGTMISSGTPITLTFSKPVSEALGSQRPPVSPATQGSWVMLNSHSIQFRPQGFGYGLAAPVTVALPHGVQLVGGQQSAAASMGTWHVPGGSPLRIQQILAELGYLPLTWHSSTRPVGSDPAGQEAAAINPPSGRFHWRYHNIPPALKGFWAPGGDGMVTKGALMAFENDHGLTTDGLPGPAVWKSLINAAIAGTHSTFGYSFVTVSVSSQSISVWHNGHSVASGPVNTGIASRPTATGTYPVYEHIASGTMSGTNPDGSHYNDPGIQYISYFNGGDALHAFNRAQYGFPQSLGCIEMPTGEAGAVYPFTPIGTLVHVA